jgi:kynurenine formamidase
MHRVQFDFEIAFSNGGGLSGRDFRLDIDGDDIADSALADYLIADLRLLMVGTVEIRNKRILSEAHKRVAAPDADFVDLSHTIANGTLTHRGLPGPLICDFLSREDSRQKYAPGTEFQIARIDMIANTGTYLDCPFHRFPHGGDMADLALDACSDLDAVVVRADCRSDPAIDVAAFQGLTLKNRAVLVHTGWDAHWDTPAYFGLHPFLTQAAAEYLRAAGAKLVGIDSMNVDDTRTATRPVHTTLLGAGILIVEHLCNLGALPDAGFAFSAVPPKLRGVGTFPVRAMARLHARR